MKGRSPSASCNNSMVISTHTNRTCRSITGWRKVSERRWPILCAISRNAGRRSDVRTIPQQIAQATDWTRILPICASPSTSAGRPRRRSRRSASSSTLITRRKSESVLPYLANIGAPFELFVSTDPIDKKDYPGRTCFSRSMAKPSRSAMFDNRGRDVAPKYVGFRDEQLACDLVLHLHTKKSPHDIQTGRVAAFHARQPARLARKSATAFSTCSPKSRHSESSRRAFSRRFIPR